MYTLPEDLTENDIRRLHRFGLLLNSSGFRGMLLKQLAKELPSMHSSEDLERLLDFGLEGVSPVDGFNLESILDDAPALVLLTRQARQLVMSSGDTLRPLQDSIPSEPLLSKVLNIYIRRLDEKVDQGLRQEPAVPQGPNPSAWRQPPGGNPA